MLDTLEYLAKGGRIGRVQAYLGNSLRPLALFKVIPIIQVKDGEAHPMERVRTRSKGLERVIAEASNTSGLKMAGVSYSTKPEEAERVAERLRPLVGSENLVMSRFGPVLGTHLGPGALGRWHSPPDKKVIDGAIAESWSLDRDTLRKVLTQERALGFQDKAMIGGLDAFLERCRETKPEGLTIPESYKGLGVRERRKWIEGALATLERAPATVEKKVDAKPVSKPKPANKTPSKPKPTPKEDSPAPGPGLTCNCTQGGAGRYGKEACKARRNDGEGPDISLSEPAHGLPRYEPDSRTDTGGRPDGDGFHLGGVGGEAWGRGCRDPR